MDRPKEKKERQGKEEDEKYPWRENKDPAAATAAANS